MSGTAEAIVTADGVRHEVDVIVFATGFHANRYLWPMEIVGRGGAVLAEQWGDEPTALLGITVVDPACGSDQLAALAEKFPTGALCSLGFAGTRSLTAVSGRANLNYQATPKDFFQINAFTSGKRLTAQGHREPFQMVNLGYRRKVNTHFLFWTVCEDRACARARACAGADPSACLLRWWPAVPEEIDELEVCGVCEPAICGIVLTNSAILAGAAVSICSMPSSFSVTSCAARTLLLSRMVILAFWPLKPC